MDDSYLNNIDISFKGTIKIEEVGIDGHYRRATNKSSGGECTTVNIYIETACPCAGHWPGQNCTCSTGPSSDMYPITSCSSGGGGSGDTDDGDGTGGGGSTTDPGDGDGSHTSLVNPDGTSASLQALTNLISLNANEVQWLTDNDTNNRLTNSVLAFIHDNDYSNEAKQFGKQAVQSWINDGEVDFEEKIINELEDKALCVFNKLKSTSTGFKNAIKKFEPDFPVAHLKFEIDYTMSSNTRKGYTRPPENYIIDIVLNGNSFKDASFQKRPNLLVAKTIIHEVIHAEMWRKLLSLANDNGDIDINKLDQMLLEGDYPGMLDYYLRYGRNINSNWQHQQMAAHYRETIARALQEFDTGIPVPADQQPSQLYKDLAWEGLIYSDITAWQQVMNNDEDSRIESVISNYINDKQNEPCMQ